MQFVNCNHNNNRQISHLLMKRILTSLLVLFFAVTSAYCQMTKSQVEAAISQSNSLIDAHNWAGAFAVLRSADASLGAGSPDLHYLVSKQRCAMYFRINRYAEVKNNLAAMEAFAMRSGNNEVIEDMLLTKAAYWNHMGGSNVSQQCYRQIFYRRAKGKDDAGVESCYKQLLAEAKQKKVSGMSDVIGKMYSAWQDSIAGIRSARELSDLKAQYAVAQQDIEDRDGTITGQWATIILLAVIAIALGAGLAFFFLMMVRNVRTIKKLRTSLDIANKSNDQKSVFIRNISGQVSPSLEEISKGNAAKHIPALRQMLAHAEEYMNLESTREERYETASINVSNLCSDIASACKGSVSVTADAPNMSFLCNKDEVTKVLNAIIGETLKDKATERITVGFKKRNPHTGNFMVSAIGMKVAEEDLESMFVPFSKIHDLTVTDGLILPICSLMAYKMGGSLSIDNSFAKGTRFILEVHC